MTTDRMLEILDDLHAVRMDVERCAQRLGVPAAEVQAAHDYDKAHGREVFMARQDRRQRGVIRLVRPLDDDGARLRPLG